MWAKGCLRAQVLCRRERAAVRGAAGVASRRVAGAVFGGVTALQRADWELQCGTQPLQTLMPEHGPSQTGWPAGALSVFVETGCWRARGSLAL